MRPIYILVFFLTFTSCKQAKQIDSFQIKNLKYTAYSFRMSLDSAELYIAHYLEINKSGRYICMRHNSFNDKAQYFRGSINDTIFSRINSTLIETTFKNTYYFKHPNSVLYCGFNYCLDYETKTGIKKTIQFVPSQSPTQIKILSALFDTLIYSTNKTKIQPFQIDSYKNKIKSLNLMVPPAPTMREQLKF
ncbi:MAG: hypothetical protein EAY66_05405 [Sphingobacteriales bacterium]|nr:MAG: hypothetical protein EAY66_05405 [Sphingobacteriales bacterium]